LAVIDVDDPDLLPELKEFLPELKETTRVRTRRGYHYYFSLNGEYVKSTNSLFGKRLELKTIDIFMKFLLARYCPYQNN